MSRTPSHNGGAVLGRRETGLIGAVARIQSLVSAQAEPRVTYQAVLDEAIALAGGDTGALRLVDLDDPGWMVAVAAQGTASLGDRWRVRAPITEGVSGRAIATGEMVVVEGGLSPGLVSQLAPPGTDAAIAVPIRERGEVVGSLVVGSRQPGRQWTGDDRELMRRYGAHAEVALSVARASHGALEALTDSLTGLGNRALLLDRLDHRLARADRGGRAVTVLFLDLDRFKIVNDSLGHIVGDQLLAAVAGRLTACLRDGDVAARLGGDEFAILLAADSQPSGLARRIIRELERPFDIDGREVFVGVSVGIASGRHEADTLLRNADVAMYHAKRSGTGRFQRFKPSMHAALVNRLGLESELRRAVERRELELHFQPLIDLRTGTLNAFESLVRWRHPARGLVAPMEFIPLAEETGLIIDIDRWVLQEACRRFAGWWRRLPLSITVNASMPDLQHPGFAAAVEQAIGGAFPASALVIEITESSRLEDAPGALASLHAAKELGVRVALDDFGTGYSTLLSMAQLPVDLVKIARPFLQAASGPSRKAAGLLAGMIDLGRHLDLTTIAEGIEDAAQLELLKELGCDVGQGYLLGRPTDADGATALVDATS